MAIGRRSILKLGVSYGSGCINFGNDSVAYDRALRKLPEDTSLKEFMDAIAEAQERMAAEAEAAAQAAAEAEAAAAAAEEAAQAEGAQAAEEAPEQEAPAAVEEAAGDAEGATEGEASPEEEEEEEPHINPLKDVMAKGYAFRAVCARLALSDMYLQTTALVNTMAEEVLPPVEDIEHLQECWDKLIDYLQHC